MLNDDDDDDDGGGGGNSSNVVVTRQCYLLSLWHTHSETSQAAVVVVCSVVTYRN